MFQLLRMQIITFTCHRFEYSC